MSTFFLEQETHELNEGQALLETLRTTNAVLEAEVAYQEFITESMLLEAGVLTEGVGSATGAIKQFFAKIGDWFRNLGKKIRKWADGVAKAFHEYQYAGRVLEPKTFSIPDDDTPIYQFESKIYKFDFDTIYGAATQVANEGKRVVEAVRGRIWNNQSLTDPDFINYIADGVLKHELSILDLVRLKKGKKESYIYTREMVYEIFTYVIPFAGNAVTQLADGLAAQCDLLVEFTERAKKDKDAGVDIYSSKKVFENSKEAVYRNYTYASEYFQYTLSLIDIAQKADRALPA